MTILCAEALGEMGGPGGFEIYGWDEACEKEEDKVHGSLMTCVCSGKNNLREPVTVQRKASLRSSPSLFQVRKKFLPTQHGVLNNGIL